MSAIIFSILAHELHEGWNKTAPHKELGCLFCLIGDEEKQTDIFISGIFCGRLKVP